MIVNPPLPPAVVAGKLMGIVSVAKNVLYPPTKGFCVWHSERPAQFNCSATSHDAVRYFRVVVRHHKIVSVDMTDVDRDGQ